MSIKVTWKNQNTPLAELSLFRTDEPLNTSTPGTPIVTLTGDQTQYIDTDTEPGRYYYYTLCVSYNGAKVFSNSKLYQHISKRGPGPQDLIYGTEELGYFGSFDIADFFYPYLAFPAILTSSDNKNRSFDVHKFIRKGKIYYMYDSWVATPSNFSAMNTYGYLSPGINWAFNYIHKQSDRIVEINDFRYRPRCMRAFPDNWDGNTSDIANLLRGDTELNAFYPTLVGVASRYATLPAFFGKQGKMASGMPAPGAIYVAEKTDITTNSDVSSCGFASSLSYGTYVNPVNIYNFKTKTSNYNYNNFYPIFELVEG